MGCDRFDHRFEPAFDASVQRVVVAALIMRLMRLARYTCRAGAKTGKASAAVAPAIGHEGVDPEIVPARGEPLPLAHPRPFHHGAPFRRAGMGETVALDGLGDGFEPIGHHLHVATAPAP